MAILQKNLAQADRRRFWTTQAVYFAVSSLFLVSLLYLPRNQDWLKTTVNRFYRQRQTLGKTTEIETRKQEGYGNAYTYINQIKQRCNPDDYFLIPPQRYLIRNAYKLGATTGYAWLYPSVLYYHLGKSVHLLEMTAPDSLLQRATHTFWVYDNKIFLLTFKDHNRPLVMAEFRKYNPLFFAYTPQQARAYYNSLKP